MGFSNSKIRILKFIDKIIGRVLIFFLPVKIKDKYRDFKNNPEELKTILLIRPGGIGDAVLLIPAIKTLKAKFPKAIIHVLCEKRNSGIFELVKEIDRIFLYDKDLDIFKCLKYRYNVLIDTEQWHRLSAVFGYLTRAEIRIGFDTNERRRLFTYIIPYSHEDYEVYSFFHLIEPLIGEIPPFDPNEPFIEVLEDLYPLDLKKINKIIAIFPGATVNERRWGSKKFGEVAKILSERGFKVLVLGSKKELEDAEEICSYSSEVINLAGKTSLPQIASILKRCNLLICADTGLLHIAYAVGTPTVSLFGSGIEKKWAPKGKKHIIINKHLECSPCTRFGYTPKCKKGLLCLSLITVNDVIKAVEELLTKINE